MNPPAEGLVDVLAEVRGEDHHAVVLLHALEEVRDFDVRVPVVRVLDFRALTEQRVGFVEEEDGVAALRRPKHPLEVALGFADVLAYDRR